jgi:hypothetical protein
MNDPIEAPFIAPSETDVLGLKLRPFSLGSLSICRKIKLSMITGDAKLDELDDEEKQRQIIAFLYIQSQPIQSVLRAIQSPNFYDKYVLPFSMDLPLHAIPEAVQEIQRVMTEAGAAYVEVQSKPGDKAEDAPPNS